MWHTSEISLLILDCPIPFTRRDLGQRGITFHALKTKKRYRQIFRGVWIDQQSDERVQVPDWGKSNWLHLWQRMSGLQLVCKEAVASHQTAATLYGLPIPRRLESRTVHVSTRDDGLRIRRHGVTQHFNTNMQIEPTAVFGVIAVPPWQVFFDLAGELTLDELVQLGDALVGKQAGGPYLSLEALRLLVKQKKRLLNRRKIKKALALIRPSVESPQETWLRLWIRERGLPEPEVHPEVRTSLPGVILHPDLGYSRHKIAIEYEGDHHRTSPEQFSHDLERISLLEAEGWTVLRVSKRTNMERFATLLTDLLATRAA